MSANTVGLIEKIKERFAAFAASPARAKVTATDVVQYNITVAGNVVKHVVFDLKQFVFSEAPASNADIEVTIDEEDVLGFFTFKSTLAELFAAGKISVKGDESLLKLLDERNQRYKDHAAAAGQ